MNLPKIREFDGHDWFSTKVNKRNLPHWELKGSTYFITTRVHSELYRPFLNPCLAKIMISTLLSKQHETYDLQAFVLMPDHLHLIIKPLGSNVLSQIMKELKGSSAFHINRELNRSGKFWQRENFDHLIRSALDLSQKWEYIKENPLKANLVRIAEEYPYSSFFNQT